MKQNQIELVSNLDKIINQKIDQIILSVKVKIIKEDSLKLTFQNLYDYVYNILVAWIKDNIKEIDTDKIGDKLNFLVQNIIKSCY